MPTIYLPKKVYERLLKFMNERVSPEFGSPKRFDKPSEAISFLLRIGENFGFEALKEAVKQPFYSGECEEERFDRELAEAKEEAKRQ